MSELEERAKALQILLNINPEDIEDYMESHQCGGTGEYDTAWNEDKLKELFSVKNEYENSPIAKALSAAEGYYWDVEGQKMNHENLRELTTRLIEDIDNDCVDKDGHTIMILRTYIK